VYDAESITKEVGAMYDEVMRPVGTSPEEVHHALQRRDELLPRSAQLEADAEYLLSQARALKAKELQDVVAAKFASVFKEALAGLTATEQRLLTLTQGLNRALAFQTKSLITQLSYLKTYLEKFPDDPQVIDQKENHGR
jgi:hypothetical protein